MTVASETYWELLRDPAHWMFELTLILVIDVLIVGLCWPLIKRWIRNHDRIHHNHECEDDK